jgi:hypothetical protein
MRDKYPHLADLADQFRVIGGKMTWVRDEATGIEWGKRTEDEGVTPILDPLSWNNVRKNPRLGTGRL